MALRAVVAVALASLSLLGAACGGDSDEPEGPISVPEALTAASGEVSVEGFAVFDGAELRLCEALAESFPPQCGGSFVVVRGIDVTEIQGTTEEQGVVWTESFVVLAGTLEDGVLVVGRAATTDAGVELIARVEVSPVAGNFGLEPGDPVPGARVELRSSSMTLDDAPLVEERTDEAGEAVIIAPGAGDYTLFATAETDDPLCFWAGGPTDAEVRAAGELVLVEALLVCE